MLKKVHIIFSGFNQRAVIAFLRTLVENNQSFAIIAYSESDTIFKTDYKSYVYTVRKSTFLDYNDIAICINEIKEKIKAHEFIIAPSTESLNRFVLKHKSEFEILGCITPLVNNELYQLVSDKYSFKVLCIKNSINVPDTYKSIERTGIPFVAKPIKYISSNASVLSPQIILNKDDKINFIKKYNPNDFFYEKFISGKSYYLLYYIHRNGMIFKSSQKNVVQQPEGKSIIAASISDFHLSKTSAKYEQLLKKINYHGFIMIEVRQNMATDYMIEANPRFWGPSQLFVDAKMNFFEVYLHDYGNLNTLADFSTTKKKPKYFWFGGMFDTLKKGKKLVFHEKSETEFLNELPNWLNIDIYRRKDTISIFKTELT